MIAGRIGSGSLADGATLEMLSGGTATINAAEKGFTIQGARIVATDIDASNGVVHVIDRVILSSMDNHPRIIFVRQKTRPGRVFFGLVPCKIRSRR